MTKLQKLSLERLRELGQVAMTALEELVHWHEKPLEDIERTKLIIKHDDALKKQCEILLALEEEAETEEMSAQ